MDGTGVGGAKSVMRRRVQFAEGGFQDGCQGKVTATSEVFEGVALLRRGDFGEVGGTPGSWKFPV